MSREMKDSGVEWLGKVPKDWNNIKFKYLLKKRKKILRNYLNEDVLSLTMKGVIKRDLENPKGKMPASFDGYQMVYEDNLLLCLFDIDVTPRCVGIINDKGIISPAYSQYEVVDNNDNKYLYYQLLLLDFDKVLVSYTKSLRNTLTDSDFGALVTVRPRYKEQVRIASFLDKKTSEIDNIVEKTKQSIEELKAYKQSLITETVTKGLDPDVPMKDSWIEWIGDIPQNWKTAKIKYIGNAKNGLTYKPIDLVDAGQGTLILRSGNIKDGNLVSNNDYYVTSKIVSEDFMLKEGDILICSRNGSKDLIGKNALITENHKYTFGAFMMRFRPYGKVNSDYIYYVLNSEVFNYYLGSFLTSTISQLTLSNFNNMNIVLPTSKCEQNKIVNYLDNRTHQIDNLISKKEKMIKELESYKQSLIYEYVTGKKEVE